MKNILVTGGLGFIGSHFIQLISEKHPETLITNVDKKTYAVNKQTEADLNKLRNYRLKEADLANKDDYSKIFDQFYDAIIHFAAESHVDRSIHSVFPFIQSNVLGTVRLLEALKEGKAKRMIHVSTDEVYGSLTKEAPPFHQKSPISPNNPYAASKASSDLFVRSFYKTYQVPVITTRSCNNFGENQHIEKLIPKTIVNALMDREVPVYGSGNQMREWIYVKDHCEALYIILMKGRVGQTYLIGSNEEKRNIDVVKNILSRLGKPVSLISYVGDRLAHDQRYSLEKDDKLNQLGWKPKFTFGAALDKTIQWYYRGGINRWL
ncbi:dTDP-glucose 4,6-dehydratase [Evansella vedderi]|uniref:dTDP-glucose 4,6-dehydratase n=1 Tax=Evansella vedderi TaxID=38282 RepID=A0ABT9ZVW3_9BACI|nr:dTDP-glucose 4,6-dehydratase [Evansella vedderi]MDQ0255376.1 dTDP-glucose 4,6-dehydratase [Evansella vedderi]